MAFQHNVELTSSTVGIVNSGSGGVNIEGDVILSSASGESYAKFDLPRMSQVFKGREEEMDKLDNLFFQDGNRKVVIFGLPGFGKTEFSKQYATRCLNTKRIEKVFWVNAETTDNLQKSHTSLSRAYNQFRNKLCLFIFDNGVSRGTIAGYEPPKIENYLLLITSQVADWGDDVKKVPMRPLDIKISIDVFKQILAHRYQNEKEHLFQKMSEFVDNVPLGLQVIAGDLRFKMDACKQKTFDLEQYIKDINSSPKYKTKINPSLHNTYQKSLFTAMSASLDKMNMEEYADPNTRKLTNKMLCICSYLYAERIHIDQIKEIMGEQETNTVDGCVYLSENFSFIDYHDGVIKIHRLCQDILRIYFNDIKEDCYSACLRSLFQQNIYLAHKTTILKHADDNNKIVKKFYDMNINDSYCIQRLLTLLIEYGCCKCIELIFCNISSNIRKHYVNNFKLLHVAAAKNQAKVLKLLLPYGDIHAINEYNDTPYAIAKFYESVEARKILFEYEFKSKRKYKNNLTLLHKAAYEGELEIIKTFIDNGADINVRDKYRQTPLHWAAWKGNLDIVQMLIERGGDIHARNIQGYKPLHWAVITKNANASIIRLLLEMGSNIHAQDNENRTALQWAVLEGNLDIVQILLEKGGDVHVQDSKGRTPLHCAAINKKADIVRLLLKMGCDVHAQDYQNRTPLHEVAQSGIADIVRLLLDMGCDIHAQDNENRTPLHWAARKRNLDVVQILLEKGGDVHARDSEGHTPLHCAAISKNADIVRLLSEMECDINAQDNESSTPLHWAALVGNLDIVKMMLEMGGDIHAQNNKRHTPLHKAVKSGNAHIVRLFLEMGCDIHAQDNIGSTPLHWAANKGNLDILQMLLEKGSDVHARNSEGHTPRDIALHSNNINIIQVLLDQEDKLRTKGIHSTNTVRQGRVAGETSVTLVSGNKSKGATKKSNCVCC